MAVGSSKRKVRSAWAVSLLSGLAIAVCFRYLPSQAVAASADPQFDEFVKPFLNQNCVKCHNVDSSTAGFRADLLESTFPDNQIKTWEAVRHRLSTATMPPKGLPQPSAEDRQRMVEWIGKGLEVARLRPAPKNGQVLRLTVSQYRNTLRELLLLEDDLTSVLPPDA